MHIRVRVSVGSSALCGALAAHTPNPELREVLTMSITCVLLCVNFLLLGKLTHLVHTQTGHSIRSLSLSSKV